MASTVESSCPPAILAAGLSGRIVAPGDLTPAERAFWKHLCDRDPVLASPFFSPYFFDALQSSGARVFVCILERENQTVGYFPFQFGNGIAKWLGAAERAGADLNDYCGLVAVPDLKVSERQLLSLSGITSFTFSNLDASQNRHGLTGEKSEIGLVARMSEGGGAYWSEISCREKSLAADTRRRFRKVVDVHGPLRFQFEAQEPHKALDDLIAAKRAQYARTRRSDVLARKWKVKLLHRIAEYREPDFRGIVSTLHAGDIWLASHFGILGRSVLHYWFPVYNHAMEHVSPGRLLYKSIVDVAGEYGIRAIDRGAGAAPSKRALSNFTHTYFGGRWTRPGPRSFAYTSAMSLKWRLGFD